jgi:hypothetical protein
MQTLRELFPTDDEVAARKQRRRHLVARA